MPSLSLQDSRSEKLGWKVVSTLGGAAGAIVTRKLIGALWAGLSSSELEPPLNPADRRIGWSEGLKWAVAAGVGAGIGRLISQRAAAAGWEAATGAPPPGMRT